jgi:hypothetical protein
MIPIVAEKRKVTAWGAGLLIFQTELTSFVHTGYWWDVSYFAQIPEGQRRKRIIIDTPSQSVRSSILTERSLSESRFPWPRFETVRAKGYTMQVPSMLQGESLTRLLQGAAAGAVATIFIGFNWGGWSLGSTADKMAKD